ncbi:porin [Pseudomonas sp. S25]|uniref:Porin n=1 Tax=Pseudomonas maioricensis TaxID=1766623 RepID=A0ABS9ZED7_9PSED|nr:OprD family porin [Pseudomonas sp. S25]MCI8208188.1 porin [Pseudomonas sp. S25]
MKKSTLALAVAFGVLAQQASAAGFLEDSKATLSSRTLYFDGDAREGTDSATNRTRNKETATGLKFDYLSGFTEGTVGFGLDVQALVGVHLDGGKGHHAAAGGITPTESDGSAVDNWSRLGGNAKARFSKTELRLGNALAPNLPILVSNDGRLLPAAYQGGVVTSKEINNLTLTGGQLTQSIGRASSNWTDLSVGGATEASNQFRFAGGDWKVTKDLTLQYYYANLQDFYKQHFLGLVHVFPISEDQSFKTDLRYFDSSSDGKNGDVGYRFNNNNGYAKNTGEVDNQTWSAMFTYSLGGHAIMVGHQQVSDDGGMVFLNQGSVTRNGGTARPEGNGGSSVYLFTDAMINNFTRAGENSTFGQYSYDFARVGIPGLKTAIAYIHAEDIRGNTLATRDREFSEWERDIRVDYVVQSGPLKGFGTTVRHGSYRGDAALNNSTNLDQTRVIFNYTYAFK